MKNYLKRNLVFYLGAYFTILMAVSFYFFALQEMRIQQELVNDSTQLADKTKGEYQIDKIDKVSVGKRLNYWREQNQIISRITKTISNVTLEFTIGISAINLLSCVFIWRRLRKQSRLE